MAGIPKTFPEIRCQGDAFHWLMELGKEVASMERKTYALLSDYEQKLDALSSQRIHEKTFRKLLDMEEQLMPNIEAYDRIHCMYHHWILDRMEAGKWIVKSFRKCFEENEDSYSTCFVFYEKIRGSSLELRP